MNQINIIGNLTRDPEIKTTAAGTRVCNFTVAVNRRSQNGHPEADYFQVIAWQGLAECCAQYLRKGKKCRVTGKAWAAAYVDRAGKPRGVIEIAAQEVEFLTPRGSQGCEDVPEGMTIQTANSGFVEVEDGEAPFG